MILTDKQIPCGINDVEKFQVKSKKTYLKMYQPQIFISGKSLNTLLT